MRVLSRFDSGEPKSRSRPSLGRRFQRRGRIMGVFAALATLGALSWSAIEVVAVDIPACVDSQATHRFTGFGSASSVGGQVVGDLTARAITLCGAKHSGSSSWIMLRGSRDAEYVQVGFARIDGMPDTKHFYEFSPPATDDHNFTRAWLPMIAPGTADHYVVSLRRDGRVLVKLNDQEFGPTPWSVRDAWGDGPMTAQFASETWDAGDDISGTPSARTEWRELGVSGCFSCSLQAPGIGSILTAHEAYRIQRLGAGPDFDSWTQR